MFEGHGSLKGIGAILAAIVLPSCTASPEYVYGADYTYVRGEEIELKRHYPIDAISMVRCLQSQIPKEYSVGFALDPHAVTSILTVTRRGRRIVEAEYLVVRRADGIKVEWRRTRRPYDDVGVLTKSAETLVEGCAAQA